MTLNCPICDTAMKGGRCIECGFIGHDLEPLTGPFTVSSRGHPSQELPTLSSAVKCGNTVCKAYEVFTVTRGRTLVKVVRVRPEDRPMRIPAGAYL